MLVEPILSQDAIAYRVIMLALKYPGFAIAGFLFEADFAGQLHHAGVTRPCGQANAGEMLPLSEDVRNPKGQDVCADAFAPIAFIENQNANFKPIGAFVFPIIRDLAEDFGFRFFCNDLKRRRFACYQGLPDGFYLFILILVGGQAEIWSVQFVIGTVWRNLFAVGLKVLDADGADDWDHDMKKAHLMDQTGPLLSK